MTSYLSLLTDPWIYASFIAGILYQIILFHTCIYGFPEFWTLKTKRSWILTTSSSIIMTLVSIPFLVQLFYYPDMNVYPWLNIPFASVISYFLLVHVSCYFMSYVLMDLVLGLIYYPDHIDKITGWTHHLLYFVLLWEILHLEKQGLFLLAGIQELPTLILSIGYLVKSLRNDIAFGFSFFLTRIVFHGYFIYKIYSAWPFQPIYYTIPLIVVPLHVYWFMKWVLQQLRLRNMWIYKRIPDEEQDGFKEVEPDALDRFESFESL